MKIAVLDWNTMTMDGDLSPQVFEEFGEVRLYGSTAPEEASAHIGDAEAVLCNKVPITRDVMEQCPDLKYIGLFATGYNNVDTVCAAENGIIVCNAGQYSTRAVVQLTSAFILDHFSRVRDYDAAVKNGEWISSPSFSYFPYRIRELCGRTISIIGYGSIGKGVAAAADAFGMRVLVNTRTKPSDCPYELAELEYAVKNADILTLHCPLTPQTKHIVNGGLLSLMKPEAVLINTSRGGAVDEAALAEALNSGKIAAAYLDVLDKEPMSAETPLRNAKNCVITPHIAWAPEETRRRLLDIVCENIRAWLGGSPINKVS